MIISNTLLLVMIQYSHRRRKLLDWVGNDLPRFLPLWATDTPIQVRYRKSPWDTCRTVKLKLSLTLVLTLTDTGGAVLTLMLGYRSLYITWQ